MKLTQEDISKTRRDALLSTRAEALSHKGFTAGEIEQATCVMCGKIDEPFLRPIPEISQPHAAMSGRYTLSVNRWNYDAGHVCAECMKKKST